MTQLNDSLWKIIFNFFYVLTDNVACVILLSSTVMTLVMICLKYKCRNIPLFFLPEFMFVCSVGNMVDRLPVIHQRIHTALQTASGIILQSETYTKSFEAVSGLSDPKSADIASFLYYLEDQSVFKYANPQMLYEHLFGTLNDIREIPFLNLFSLRVDVNCSGTKTAILFVIFLLIMLMLQVSTTGLTKRGLILFMIQSGFLIFAATWNIGALICGMCIWIFECTFQTILFSSSYASV